jgi:hypothetical protein
MKVSGQLHAPAAPPLGRDPGKNLTRVWVGPRAGLDAVTKRKNYPYSCRESHPSRPTQNAVIVPINKPKLFLRRKNENLQTESSLYHPYTWCGGSVTTAPLSNEHHAAPAAVTATEVTEQTNKRTDIRLALVIMCPGDRM